MDRIRSQQETLLEATPFSRLITREMVHIRTAELASLAGRNSHEINQRDYEQAKRELTGESDFDKQQALLDSGIAC